MSKRCKLQKEYYKQYGNYKGDGIYSDHYVKWLESEVIALRIDSVTGSIGIENYDLKTLIRTLDNKHLCVCDLCKLKPICTDESDLYKKCIKTNTDDQYYQ